MRKYQLLFLLFILNNLTLKAQISQDAYGYTFVTSNDCAWMDIREKGQKIEGLTDDNVVGPFQIGFDFQYYWTTVSTFYIGSNGYISFDPITISSAALNFPPIPFPGDANSSFIAPLLSDLKFDGAGNPGAVYIYNNNVDTCVISFHNVPFWTGTTANQYAGDNNFQIILTGGGNGITFNYQEMEAVVAPEYQTGQTPVIIGMESSNGNIGLPVAANMPNDNSCVQIIRPDSALIEVFDATPLWIFNDNNQGFFVGKGEALQPTIGVKNIGNVDMTEVQVFITVLDQVGSVLAATNQSISEIGVGETEVLTFSETINIDQVGSYNVTAQLISSQDINMGNDVTTNKIIVVDTEAEEYQLGYIPNNLMPTGPLSWLSSTNFNNGGGVYIQPPTYPIKIEALAYYLFDVGNPGFTHGFRAQILADDGANGGPGSVLFEKDIAATNLNANNWINVSLDEPLTITEGGVYLAFRQEGTDIGLGATTGLSAYSRQTWEILNGEWGPYRGANAQDFFIRATASNKSTATTPHPSGESFYHQLAPNPFQTNIWLQLHLTEKQNIEWQLLSIDGRTIGTKQRTLNAGSQILSWEGAMEHLPNGVYLSRLKIGNEVVTERIVKQ